VSIACPPRRNASDGERKGKGDPCRITIRAETDFPTNEAFEGAQQRVVSGFPSFPNTLWCLPGVYVTSPFHTEAAVNFMTPMHAIAANNPVQAGSNRGHGVFRFAENPHLDHVARFPVITRCFKSGRDDDSVLVFVENEAIQSKPPIHSQNAGMAIKAAKPKAASGPWKRGGMRSFMSQREEV
jgi:hypothetical protein